MRGLRRTSTTSAALAILALVLALAAPARAQRGGFVGETRCGNPTCHGAGLPRDEAARKIWRPWKSARTQWRNRAIDRHSRAYDTLTTAGSKAIAGFMGVDATRSEKCLVCHAPAATLAAKSGHRRSDGVSCEHCHGPAEHWLQVHVERDWKAKKPQYLARGFYNNNNFSQRARKCASCHVEIDHEIVAAGHPPLQFELVAYAQIMKHWDDQDEQPPGAYSVDPTIWAVGQLTGLRQSMRMLARRAGRDNYQGLGKFPHFQDRNCYQCHHKLVDDAVRQARGHYQMVDAILASVAPGERGALGERWRGVVGASQSSAGAARDRARGLERWLASFEDLVRRQPIGRDATKTILRRLTASADELKRIERFRFSRSPSSNVVAMDNVSSPWWWTTGAPEQTILAIQALCDPAYGARCRAIDGDMNALVRAVDRWDYRPDAFAASLGAIGAKLR